MTDSVASIRFDHLTWPEVAALPRDLPIVLPLGEGFRTGEIAARLGASACAMLPPFPFGWPQSLLPVPQTIFKQVIVNLFAGLREDGFQKLFLLSEDKPDFELDGIQTLMLNTNLSDASALKFDPGRVVLIPTGHTEQHGHHLPLNTDSEIISAIADGVSRGMPDLVTVLPVLPYGVSTHRRAFAGTFNLGGRAYEEFLLAVLDHLVAQGADCFYLLNGHGGNHSFLVNVVKYAGESHPQAFTATAWLHTSGTIGAAALERLRLSARGGMGHAGELETAFMLHLQPGLVHMENVVDEIDFIASDVFYMDWIEGGELVANPPWEDDTRTGSYGAGSLATAEHGRQWLKAAVEEKIAHVHAVLDQHARRRARRLQG